MQLQALEQIHISAVQPDTIRPGQVFHISDSAGDDLLKKHPAKFVRVDAGDPDSGDPAEKSEAPPQNKAEPTPANKSASTKKAKGDK
jgi:hypothetical protein